jgi:hypothetical protein
MNVVTFPAGSVRTATMCASSPHTRASSYRTPFTAVGAVSPAGATPDVVENLKLQRHVFDGTLSCIS